MSEFHHDLARHRAALAWRNAATADGWQIRPTYETEPLERAATLISPDGFRASIITRTNTNADKARWVFETSIDVWGPDGLYIKPPTVYDRAAVHAGVLTCNYCGAHPVPTGRVGFAGRACLTCQPVQESKLGRHYYD